MPDGEKVELVENTMEIVQPDYSVYEAKISELTATLAERETAYTALTADLTASKAANYDLLISSPGAGTQVITPDIDTAGSTDVDFDDFFD